MPKVSGKETLQEAYNVYAWCRRANSKGDHRVRTDNEE